MSGDEVFVRAQKLLSGKWAVELGLNCEDEPHAVLTVLPQRYETNVEAWDHSDAIARAVKGEFDEKALKRLVGAARELCLLRVVAPRCAHCTEPATWADETPQTERGNCCERHALWMNRVSGSAYVRVATPLADAIAKLRAAIPAIEETASPSPGDERDAQKDQLARAFQAAEKLLDILKGND